MRRRTILSLKPESALWILGTTTAAYPDDWVYSGLICFLTSTVKNFSSVNIILLLAPLAYRRSNAFDFCFRLCFNVIVNDLYFFCKPEVSNRFYDTRNWYLWHFPFPRQYLLLQGRIFTNLVVQSLNSPYTARTTISWTASHSANIFNTKLRGNNFGKMSAVFIPGFFLSQQQHKTTDTKNFNMAMQYNCHEVKLPIWGRICFTHFSQKKR